MLKVKQAMHKGAVWREPSVTVAQLSQVMAAEDIGAIPIGENDRLIGMVTDRDIVLRAFEAGGNSSKVTAGDVMSEGIIYCQEEESVEDAIRLMEKKQVRRLPVINAKKRLVGMLSLGDISQAVHQSLSGELVKSVSAHHSDPILLTNQT